MRDGCERDVALLIGVPVEYETFVERVRSSDWLSKFNDTMLDESARDEHVAARWTAEYLPFVAQPLRELMHTAAAMGVHVYPDATLARLAEAAAAPRRDVILFAHWKGPEIINDDFLRPMTADDVVRQVASAADTSSARWLRANLESLRPSVEPRRPWQFWKQERPIRTVRELLSSALMRPEDDDVQPSEGVDLVVESDVTRLARRRDELDALFGGFMKPGNRLELFDGLHSKEAVEAALPESFEGVLDLTTCTSTVLADHLGRVRRQQLRTVQFPEVQEFLWAAQCVELTLRLAVEQCLPYLEARSLATTMMETAVAQHIAATS